MQKVIDAAAGEGGDTPAVVIRPIELLPLVNHRAPSGPAVMPPGAPIPGYSETTTWEDRPPEAPAGATGKTTHSIANESDVTAMYWINWIGCLAGTVDRDVMVPPQNTYCLSFGARFVAAI